MSLEAWGDEGDDGYRSIDTLIEAGWVSPEEISPAQRDVMNERIRQESAEGWTPAHDDQHTGGELRTAGACYIAHSCLPSRRRAELALSGYVPEMWPFDKEWWKPTTVRRDLVKGLALEIAEIERLDRAEAALAAEGAKS